MRNVIDLEAPGGGVTEIPTFWGGTWIVEPVFVGDVNGDGFDDLFFHDPDPDAQDFRMAGVLVYGGANLGPSVRIEDVDHTRVWFGDWRTGIYPAVCERGQPYVAAGDVDEDGYSDILFGSCSTDYEERENSGAALLVFGAPEYPEEMMIEDLGAFGVRSVRIGAAEGLGIGWAVARVGDLNDDGRSELAVSTIRAPDPEEGSSRAGRVYVIDGSHEFTEDMTVEEIGGRVPGFVVHGARGKRPSQPNGDRFGSDVAAGGDFNGDGYGDFLIAARLATRVAPQGGAVYVVYGAGTFPNELLAADPGRFGVEFQGGTRYGSFGSDVRGVGDIDGDGLDDFVVGAPGPSSTREISEAFVIFGSREWPDTVRMDRPEVRVFKLESTVPAFTENLAAINTNTSFGIGVAGLGDWNDDGFADFVLTASDQIVHLGTRVGAAYVVYGGMSLPALALDTDVGGSSVPGVVILGKKSFSELGVGVDAGGDFNGGGKSDLILSAPLLAPRCLSDSSIFLVYGETVSGALPPELVRVEPSQAARTGGVPITLRGRRFTGGERVFFGDTEAEVLRTVSTAELVVSLPASGSLGGVTVEVENDLGRSVLRGGFEYVESEYSEISLGAEEAPGARYRASRITDVVRGPRPFLERQFASCYAADLNGDTIEDLIVGAMYDGFEGGEGEVLIVFGRKEFPSELEWAGAGQGQALVFGELGFERFGLSIGIPGDLNRDGMDDLVIGGAASLDGANFQSREGRTYILFGRERWREFHFIEEEVRHGGAVVVESAACGFPTVAGVGDIDGSGRNSFLVGGLSCKGTAAQVRLFFEANLDGAIASAVITGDPRIVEGSDSPRGFGTALSAAGDVNGDGVDDFVVGAHHSSQSEVRLILGGQWDPAASVNQLMESGRTVALRRELPLNEIGLNCAPAGDFNGDGLGDFLIGDHFGGCDYDGEVFVVLGDRGFGQSRNEILLEEFDQEPGVIRIVGEHPGDQLGSVSPLGDIDGDGVSDIGIVPFATRNQQARAYVIFGNRQNESEIRLKGELAARGFRIVGAADHWFSGGWGGMGGGDFNSDGVQDIAIGEMTPLGKSVVVLFGRASTVGEEFVRGDANSDRTVNLADAVALLNALFSGPQPIACEDAADADDSGALSITDAVYLLGHLFAADSPPPPAPFPEAGVDPTPDTLGCAGV